MPSTAGNDRGGLPGRLGRRGAFGAAAAVLALALWSSGAPSVLYPLYAQRWDLPPIVVTGVFASYQLALVVTLPLLGSLSDRWGRRHVMIAGVALLTLSAVLLAVAPHVGFLYAGRLLQGVGVGLSMGAATASLTENTTGDNPRAASSAAALATSAGLTAALVLGGLLAEYVPLPLVSTYLVLLLLTVLCIGALLMTPRDEPRGPARWRPHAPRVPTGSRLPFWVATTSVATAYCVGAIFLSLGAHLIGELAHTSNRAIVGALLGCSSAVIGVTALVLPRVAPQTAVRAGALLTLVSLGLMAAASAVGSIWIFLGWCVVGGVAYACAFAGGLGVLDATSSDEHRGGTLSVLYLVAYGLQAVTALGVGALATVSSLETAVAIAAVVLAAGCVLLLLLSAMLAAAVPRHRVEDDHRAD